jgi:DNA-binding transcriptional MerR regulator
MSAWSDYLDARQQLVHQWRDNGMSIEDIVHRLEVDAESIESWLKSAPLPYPGSSRAQLAAWKTRAAELEAALHAARSEPPPPGSVPAVSEMRGLRLHPEPSLCGCQYWTDAPLEDAHHPRCIHAKA